MKPGDTIQVVKGKHEGRQGLLRGTSGWYYHVQLLTPSGHKSSLKPVTLHRASVAPLEG